VACRWYASGSPVFQQLVKKTFQDFNVSVYRVPETGAGALTVYLIVGLLFASIIAFAAVDAIFAGELGLLDDLETRGIQIRFVPETIAIACSLKLVFDNRKESLTDKASIDVILRDTANPDIDIVGRTVS
jgi:hypothetical protein